VAHTEPGHVLATLGTELRVRTATIGGDVASNSFTCLPLALEIRMEIAFEPVARLALGPLDLPMRRWTDLTGVEWQPPRERTTRMADGEEHQIRPSGGGFVELGDERIALAAERISFGDVRAEGLEARLAFRLDTSDSPGAEELSVVMTIGPIRVIGDVITKPRPNLEDALRLASEFVDVDAFDSHVTNGVVELVPR
jgi:hypothetical protein